MREKILAFLENFELEGGGNIISRDLMRALDVDGSKASFVLEAPSPDVAKSLDSQRLKIQDKFCLLYTSPSPRDRQKSRMPSSA